jgi:hypothetical protein
MDLALIIGAGASKDIYYGFGLGYELINCITESLSEKNSILSKGLMSLKDDQKISYSDIWQFVFHVNEYIKNVENPSIDEFLNEIETFPEFIGLKDKFILIGQLSILYFITEWEKEMAKYHTFPENVIVTDSWLKELIKIIEEKKLLTSNEHSLQIITFNYDRSIEFILGQYFKYNNKGTQINDWLENNIFHVYGRVSKMNEFQFGTEDNNIKRLLNFKNNIKTIFSNRSFLETRTVKKGDRIIENADYLTVIANSGTIAAFGFGFDYFNCREIGFDNFFIEKTLNANLFPFNDTGFKRRRSETDRVRRMVRRVDIKYLTCGEFLGSLYI